MINSNTIIIGGEFVQEETTLAENEYIAGESTLKQSELKKNQETYNGINNTMTNSNTIYSLDTENDEEINNNNKQKHISNMNLSSDEIMDLKELLKIKNQLMKVVNEDNANYDSITNTMNNTIFDDIQPQTIHVSQKVFKEFKKFTKEHNTTLKQAVSLALLHYMNGFRNK